MAPNVKINTPPLRRPNPRKHDYMRLANTKPVPINIANTYLVPKKPNFTNVSSIVANVVSSHPSGSKHIEALVRMLLMKPQNDNDKKRVKNLKNLKIKEYKPFLDQVVSDLKHFIKHTAWIPENFVEITQEPFRVKISVFNGIFIIFVYKDYLKIHFMQYYKTLFNIKNINKMTITQ